MIKSSSSDLKQQFMSSSELAKESARDRNEFIARYKNLEHTMQL